MKNWIALSLAFILAGCAGGTITLASEDLAGTYVLTGFQVTYSNGAVISSEDGITYSGTMVLTSDGRMSQSVSLNGTTGGAVGVYVVATTSSLTVTADGFSCSYNLGVDRNGNTLTLTLASGQCGITYTEVDTWTRISTDANLLVVDTDEEVAAPSEIFPGSIIGGGLEGGGGGL